MLDCAGLFISLTPLTKQRTFGPPVDLMRYWIVATIQDVSLQSSTTNCKHLPTLSVFRLPARYPTRGAPRLNETLHEQSQQLVELPQATHVEVRAVNRGVRLAIAHMDDHGAPVHGQATVHRDMIHLATLLIKGASR